MYISPLFIITFLPICYYSSMSKRRSLTTFVTAEEQFNKFLSYMPNPDHVLNSTDEQLEIVEEMLSDAHIVAKLEELKNGVLSREWQITPGDNSPLAEEIAARVTEIVAEELDIDNDLEELITALEYGYAISEVIWKEEGAEWLPESLKGRRQTRFRFKSDGTPVFQKNGLWKELKQEYKFIVFRPYSLNENPYGRSILMPCYWPWKFKRAGWKFWLVMMDKFGVPSILALFNTEEQDEEKLRERAAMIAAELEKLESSSAIALANVEKTEMVANSGTSEDFKTFLELCNSEMSKAITGSILTSDAGTHGSYAQSQTHNQTKDIKTRRLARKLAHCISRTLIRWIVELNWGEGVPLPRFSFDMEELPAFETLEKAINLGIPVSKRALYEKYNIPEPKDEEDTFIKASSPPPLPLPDEEEGADFADALKAAFFLQRATSRTATLRNLRTSSAAMLPRGQQ